MVSQIASVLAAGIAPKKILDFIMRQNPNFAEKIKGMLAAGFTVEKILQFFDKPENFQQLKQKVQQSQIHPSQAENPLVAAETIKQKGLAQDSASRLGAGVKGALQIGAGLAAGYGASKLGQYALSKALPSAVQTLNPEMLQKVPIPPPAPQEQPQEAQIPQPETIPQEQIAQKQQQIVQPEPPQSPPIPEIQALEEQEKEIQNLWSNLNNRGASKDPFIKYAKSLVKKGDIKDYDTFKNFYKYWKATEGEKRGNPLIEFENFRRKTSQFLPQEKPNKIEQISQPSKNEVVGNLALLPNGEIGEIESEKNGIAKVNVDGKERHRKLSEEQKLPVTQTDLADLYENLIQAIPEDRRSAMINFAGYDEDANELIFRPHNGAAYVYKNIPPEFAKKLKDAMFKAKTTGENFYRAWSEGEATRGGGMYQLIKELQKTYGGKGKEYIRKYQTLFDILGAPEEAKKAKMKAKKEANKNGKRKKKAV